VLICEVLVWVNRLICSVELIDVIVGCCVMSAGVLVCSVCSIVICGLLCVYV